MARHTNQELYDNNRAYYMAHGYDVSNLAKPPGVTGPSKGAGKGKGSDEDEENEEDEMDPREQKDKKKKRWYE